MRISPFFTQFLLAFLLVSAQLQAQHAPERDAAWRQRNQIAEITTFIHPLTEGKAAKEGIAIDRKVFDEEGRTIRQLQYDQNGMESRRLEITFDPRNHEKRTQTYAGEDSLISLKTDLYNEFDLLMESQTVDEAGNMLAATKILYDKQQHPIEQFAFSSQARKDDVYLEVKRYFDKSGLLIKQKLFQPSGKAEQTQWFHYDLNRHEVEMEGNPKGKRQILRKRIYSPRGWVIEEIYASRRFQFKYDDNGNILVKNIYEGESLQEVVRFRYNRRGWLVEKQHFQAEQLVEKMSFAYETF
ncbi:MAG: hypothetical protein AAF206_30685 [Bacteroidota bacterium]